MFNGRQEFNKTTIILWVAALTMLFLAGRVNFPFFHRRRAVLDRGGLWHFHRLLALPPSS